MSKEPKKTTHNLKGCQCPKGSDIRFCLGETEPNQEEKFIDEKAEVSDELFDKLKKRVEPNQDMITRFNDFVVKEMCPVRCGHLRHKLKDFLLEERKRWDLEKDEKYYELIMAVENKYKGETRHQTALRIIKNSQKSESVACEETK